MIQGSLRHIQPHQQSNQVMANSTLLVRCFEVSGDNRLIEVPSYIRYKDFQEIINKKYDNHPMLIQYIDESGEQVTIDSEFVFEKAKKMAIQVSYYTAATDETELRIVVQKLATVYFQCFECGSQFARDPRSELSASGGPNICADCWS